MDKIEIPDFAKKAELFDFLIENKDALIAQKKYNVKHADAVLSDYALPQMRVSKAEDGDSDLSIDLVINTTKWLDSHGDVHIDGLWNKSLKENKNLYLLEEHRMSFKGIISDEIKASAKMISWNELGLKIPGETQALVFSSKISKDRNPYMYEQYQKKRVRNHSVGMRYVKLFLALNDPDRQEFEVWEKYIDQIANKKTAEDQGFFWAVKEAKVIEGSAVPIGSNTMTPALYDKSEPLQNTPPKSEPQVSTLKYLTENFKL